MCHIFIGRFFRAGLLCLLSIYAAKANAQTTPDIEQASFQFF